MNDRWQEFIGRTFCESDCSRAGCPHHFSVTDANLLHEAGVVSISTSTEFAQYCDEYMPQYEAPFPERLQCAIEDFRHASAQA